MYPCVTQTSLLCARGGKRLKGISMKYMQISIWKDAKNRPQSTGYMKNKRFYNLTWFRNPAFRKSDSESDRKDYVRKLLSELDLDEKSIDENFDETERVVVTVEGNHNLEDAIFDEEMDLPDNLIDSNKNNDKGDDKKW